MSNTALDCDAYLLARQSDLFAHCRASDGIAAQRPMKTRCVSATGRSTERTYPTLPSDASFMLAGAPHARRTGGPDPGQIGIASECVTQVGISGW